MVSGPTEQRSIPRGSSTKVAAQIVDNPPSSFLRSAFSERNLVADLSALQQLTSPVITASIEDVTRKAGEADSVSDLVA
jgi:hypothetical protein